MIRSCCKHRREKVILLTHHLTHWCKLSRDWRGNYVVRIYLILKTEGSLRYDTWSAYNHLLFWVCLVCKRRSACIKIVLNIDWKSRDLERTPFKIFLKLILLFFFQSFLLLLRCKHEGLYGIYFLFFVDLHVIEFIFKIERVFGIFFLTFICLNPFGVPLVSG